MELPEGFACLIPPSTGPIFGKGMGHFRMSGKQTLKSSWNEHKIIVWSHWPYMYFEVLLERTQNYCVESLALYVSWMII